MNKIFKLILTFVIILGAIVGGFFLFTKSPEPLPPVNPDTYEMYRKQFIEDWKQKGDWDEQLFMSHCDLVNQLSTNHNVVPLKDMNTSTAVEVVHDKIFTEWASATCKKKTIDKYVKAISIIGKEDSNAKSNPLVIQINDVHKVYKSAYDQAYQGISLEPEFNGSSWKSYDDYSRRVRAKRDNILNDETYKKHLSNIADIKKNLNNIPDRLSSARTKFYNSLAMEIVDYYNAIPDSTRTSDQLTALRASRNNYEDEYTTSSAINECARQFNVDVQNNETKAKLNESL